MSETLGEPGTLPELLDRSVRDHSDATALILETERVTYAELAERSSRVAAGLVARGVGKGSHVGLLMENSADWVAAAFAVTGLGAVLVPVSTFSMRDDLAYQLRHGDVAVLLMSAGFLGHDYLDDLLSVAPELQSSDPGRIRARGLPALRSVVVRGDVERPRACEPWEALDDEAGVPRSVLDGLRNEVDPEDDCYLLYTSGTTAAPKGVLHRHRSVAGNGWFIGEHQALGPDDVVWFHFPLFFSAGCINVMLGGLSHGASLILAPTFDAGTALAAIDEHEATAWHLWPHVFKALKAHPDWGRRERAGLCKGTGPFDLAIGATHPDGLGGVNMYGLTETCTAFTCTSASDPPEVRLKTQGLPLPGNEVRIVNPETGEPLADGEEGEIAVRGPSVMRRYYKVDPALTFDADGFFRTGDLGRIDPDGRLRFLRRLSEVIKTAGMNVSPAEVEQALRKLDGVHEAYAFALPSADRDEVVGAAVVVDRPGAVSEGDVLDHCREALPRYKRPVAVLVLAEEDVPMTGTGKVQRRLLRERLLGPAS